MCRISEYRKRGEGVSHDQARSVGDACQVSASSQCRDRLQLIHCDRVVRADRFRGRTDPFLTAEVNDPTSQLAAFVDHSSQPHDLESGANVLLLDRIVATKPYLSPHSDLVALMVLEHQTQMHNAIAAANYETRAAIHQSYQMNELLDREEGHISDSANRRIDAVAARVARYLLMCDEFELKDPVSGTSEFAKEFQARGTRDTASPDKILEILMAT